jgi:hypothetical protein
VCTIVTLAYGALVPLDKADEDNAGQACHDQQRDERDAHSAAE